MILLTTNTANAYDFLFNNLWDNAYYWRYTTIIAIFLMVVYKRKVSFYEKCCKRLENDKNIVRKALFLYSEVNLKELMKNIINNNCYSNDQINNLKEFEKYLHETENKLVSENLKKAVEEVMLTLNNSINFLGKYFIKDTENDFFKLKTDSNMDSVDEFELQDKILTVITTFESKYFNFVKEIKNEFI